MSAWKLVTPNVSNARVPTQARSARPEATYRNICCSKPGSTRDDAAAVTELRTDVVNRLVLLKQGNLAG